jgi:phosphate acetyltransferase
VIPEDVSLSRPSVADIAQEFGGELLHGTADSLKRDIGRVKVASMNLAHFLERLEPGTLVLTSGDRSDILLGSFVANRSVAATGLAGIVLTGGLRPSLHIGALVGGLSDESLPVLLVNADTYETATRVHDVRAWLRADDDAKLARALGLFEACVDVEELEDRIELTRPGA